MTGEGGETPGGRGNSSLGIRCVQGGGGRRGGRVGARRRSLNGGRGGGGGGGGGGRLRVLSIGGVCFYVDRLSDKTGIIRGVGRWES